MLEGLARYASALIALFAAGTARTAPCSVGTIAQLPVTMSRMQPLVPVKVDGQDIMLLADSGAFTTIITPGTAASLKLRVQDPPRGFDNSLTIEGVGGVARTQVVIAQTFSLDQATVRNVTLIVGGSETGAGGVLGRSVLNMADVDYNLSGGMISIVKPQNCGKTPLVFWTNGSPYSVIDLDSNVTHTEPIGIVSVNGVPLRALFDTGSSSSIMSMQAAARVGLKPDGSGVSEEAQVNGIGRGIARTWLGRIDSFKIDGEEIRRTKMRFGQIGGLGFDMIIGADFFLSHHIYIANGQHKLYLTYSGGPFFNFSGKPIVKGAPTVGPTPAVDTLTAAELARLGAAKVAQRDFDGAIADFSHAVTAEPGNPRYLVQRAQALLTSGKPDLARSDLDRALELAPRDSQARLDRAAILLRQHAPKEALPDLDAAARLLDTPSDDRMRLAGLYAAADAFDPAVAQFNQWISTHPADSRIPDALNGRCWTRALAGRDLGKAESDCNAALRARPGAAMFLDSRALVRLRSGNPASALPDYDAALAVRPKGAWSLYGKGLAELRLGREADGKRDIAAALQLAPRMTDLARAYGIVPPEGEPR